MKLARKYDGEIICADSRTVYKGMDIGTAKPSKHDKRLVPHHLLDIASPDEKFNVSDFKKRAEKAIQDIQNRGRIPFLTGGSGLYIDAVLFDYGFSSPDAPRSRENPRHLAKTAAIEKKNLRANTLIIGVKVPQDTLKRRIAARAVQMVGEGLADEVKALSGRYGWEGEPMKGLGYKQWRPFFAGEQTKEETIGQIIDSTKKYAKRQMTWFRRNKNIIWVKDLQEADKLIEDFVS
jgi:tRNA dimethylallyltransferase